MKKLHLLLLSFVCLCSLNAFATSHSNNNMPMKKQFSYSTPCKKPCTKTVQKEQSSCLPKCPQTYVETCSSKCFLCTNKNMLTLFKEMNLSETQICNAMKIQDKYELEVLSLNERLQCEEANLCQLKQRCSKGSETRATKRTIKELKKKRKEICKCYEKQFKTTLSDQQKRAYRKHKKCN